MAWVAKWMVIGSLVLLSIWGAGLWLFVRHVPDASEPTRQYDAIIALTGGEQRLSHAIDLLLRDTAPVLFISGVADGFRFEDLQGDIPASLKPRIHYGEHARSTVGNAEEAAQWLETTSHQRLLIVTANYHMPRVMLLFGHYLSGYQLDYAPVDPPQFHRERWWQHQNSRRLVFSEYHKWLVTWMRLQARG